MFVGCWFRSVVGEGEAEGVRNLPTLARLHAEMQPFFSPKVQGPGGVPNQLALKMDGAGASGPYPAVAGSRRGARGTGAGARASRM